LLALIEADADSLATLLALAEAALVDADAEADSLATLLVDWLALADAALVDSDAEADWLALVEALSARLWLTLPET
jgi:hypothetical protein